MRVVVCYGTRPERIKLQPVIEALREKGATVDEWWSGQSADLFPDRPLPAGDWRDGIHGGIAHTLRDFRWGPSVDAVIVQGDTATAFSCALAAFLDSIPVAHVEAGLRTYHREPYPEEAFRRMIAAMATWHFCPDEQAAMNVSTETGYAPLGDRIHVVGNTVIDALPKEPFRVLATLHRRENWGLRLENALFALDDFGQVRRASVNVIRHPNWRRALTFGLHEIRWDGLQFLDPMPHAELLGRIKASDLIVTDSGGLQEEAAHFGKPCIVVRTATERTALLQNGAVELVHPDRPEELRNALDRHLARRRAYGNGDAGRKIAEILTRELAKKEAA